MRRVRPIDWGTVEPQSLGGCAQVALIVDRVRGGECAVDVENRELGRSNPPSWKTAVDRALPARAREEFGHRVQVVDVIRR
jgi:hypothetical protein